MTAHFRIAQPPPRPLVLTGRDAEALIRTAGQVQAKGTITAQRVTRLTDGIRYFVQITSAKNRHTTETWTLAAYHAETPRGHVRRVLITPDGKAFTLFPSTGSDPARAVHSQNKYRANLWRISQQHPQKGLTK